MTTTSNQSCYGLIQDFNDNQLKVLEARFKDIKAVHGFLYINDSLIDVYRNYMEVLQFYKVTTQQIANVLTAIKYKYDRKLELTSKWRCHTLS